MTEQPDFRYQNHGSIYLLQPLSAEAIDWADEHLPDDAPRWGGAYAIEPRYLVAILDGIHNDGLSIRAEG
jgi:hypothetical protein